MQNKTMSKIYREADGVFPRYDSEKLAKEYDEACFKIANCLSQMDDLREHIKYLHEIADDDPSPSLDLETAIEKLGVALASCTVYKNEYMNESLGVTEENEND